MSSADIAQFNKLASKKKNSRIKLFFIMLLNMTLIICLGIVITVYGPIIWSEVQYSYNVLFDENYKKREQEVRNIPKRVKNQEILLDPVNPIPEPQDKNFSIVIPKISVNRKVVSDIDLTNEKEVAEALKHGIGWAKGTVEPGDFGNSLLFSHSARNVWDIERYNSEFTLLNKLQIDDLFTVVYKGRQFDFIVYEKQIVPAGDISYLTSAAEGRIVTLQTCHPPGFDSNRLLVRGRLIAMQTF